MMRYPPQAPGSAYLYLEIEHGSNEWSYVWFRNLFLAETDHACVSICRWRSRTEWDRKCNSSILLVYHGFCHDASFCAAFVCELSVLPV
jgi:hypothetical protein